jgi:hypothetical protein
MPWLHSCRALAPAFVCQHADMLLYLAPSLALAFLIRVLASAHPVFFVLTVAGTICHELAHFFVGLVTGARPSSLTILPRRVGRHWELGSVTLLHVRWYNAAPAALAPFLIVTLPLAVAWWRTRPGWAFEPTDLAIAFALAPQLLSFWPSPLDWRVAARSWPWLPILGAALCLWQFGRPALFQFVTQ